MTRTAQAFNRLTVALHRAEGASAAYAHQIRLCIVEVYFWKYRQYVVAGEPYGQGRWAMERWWKERMVEK